MPSNESRESHRFDKWLWCCRFYKTRQLAIQAIAGGKAHLNAERVKPAHKVRVGDRVILSQDGIAAEFEVLALPERRGPATEAQAHYRETAASALRRAEWRSQQRLAQMTRPRPPARPDKRDRRRLMRLQREQT